MIKKRKRDRLIFDSVSLGLMSEVLTRGPQGSGLTIDHGDRQAINTTLKPTVKPLGKIYLRFQSTPSLRRV
jgi:hypothetical protein